MLTEDGRWLVLWAPGTGRVTLGPYHNPAVAKQRLAEVRGFAAALIRSAAVGAPEGGRPLPPRTTDGGYPIDSDLHQMTDDGGPLSPDPARWADPLWSDDPNACDTHLVEGAGVDDGVSSDRLEGR